jgi:HEAT repeat protein
VTWSELTAAYSLTKTLKDEDETVCAYAADALGAIGPRAKSAVPALQEAANRQQFSVSAAAKDTLHKIRGG